MQMTPQSSRCCWTLITSRHCTRLSDSQPHHARNHSNASRLHPIIPGAAGAGKTRQSHFEQNKIAVTLRDRGYSATDSVIHTDVRSSMIVPTLPAPTDCLLLPWYSSDHR